MTHLFTPGPVPVPPEVQEACARRVLYHHSQDFSELSRNVWRGLQEVFCTTGPVLTLSGSGMTGIEACIASTVRRGDRVVVLQHGRFGARLVTINKLYGAHVIELSVSLGETISPELVQDRLKGIDGISTVWLVHSETSTGVALDLAGIASVVREYAPHALLMVDAVLTLAIQELKTDEWHLDAVVAGIQKGLMCPPGIACVAISEKFIARMSACDPSSYTLDLRTVLDFQRRGLSPWTPPVSLMAGLDVSLTDITNRGLHSIWQHHNELVQFVQQQCMARGFTQFGDGTSRGVVVVQHPEVSMIIHELAERHNIIVAGGQDTLKDKVMRIGTCGSYTIKKMTELFAAIDSILLKNT
ncbi:MAG: aminotransferase class V-fold PLP-dependent enzyme [Candidatus Kapabacteria bacterium]|nr:aminotransferase class V-fold PLP-dependent enzyme [Candidatus Kapabacteria bacterium]